MKTRIQRSRASCAVLIARPGNNRSNPDKSGAFNLSTQRRPMRWFDNVSRGEEVRLAALGQNQAKLVFPLI